MRLLTLAALVMLALPSLKAEIIQADYFDIARGSGSGTEVTGRIHLQRNKDVHRSPIPAGYAFAIAGQPEKGLFEVNSLRDSAGRLTGLLTVGRKHRLPDTDTVYTLQMELRDGKKVVDRFDIRVNVVPRTLYDRLHERYMPRTTTVGRLWGSKKIKDSEVEKAITALEANGWKWPGLEKAYNGDPTAYTERLKRHKEGDIVADWCKIVNHIGSLGYAYAKSKTYGPNGDPAKRARLREAIYNSLDTYINSVPVNGWEMIIDGEPIGTEVGDGLALMPSRKMCGEQTPTHQWMLTDGLVTPILHLMPDLLEHERKGDRQAAQLHDDLVRYFQVFMSIVKARRRIDDPGNRWGELRDTVYSSGAWADANLGHRSRTMMALPLIWADYNRPITYVPYWYRDFYTNPPFEGFSFSPGWEPRGIISDLSYWMTKYNVPTHRYIQSGFQPDGAISHHIGQGTDMSMTAYGFEWLTEFSDYYNYFRDTPFRTRPEAFEFQVDRLVNTYPKMFYKGQMDFLATGRNFLADQSEFVSGKYLDAVKSLHSAIEPGTEVAGLDSLDRIADALRRGEWETTVSYPFWVTEFLVHRRGGDAPFYASLKLKSRRTVGCEDFSRDVRRSWHAGYGIMPVRVTGDEYTHRVLGNYDWHVLPGLTEEWRTDPMPLGHSQASLPGDNVVAAVAADAHGAMGIYHHLPREKYSSATGYKSYHMAGDRILSQGSAISRRRPGQGRQIVTTVDQSALTSPLTLADGRTIKPGESVSLTLPLGGKPTWLHTGSKGYVIWPCDGGAALRVVTGDSIAVTDASVADGTPGYIIAIDHGTSPDAAAYRYAVVPGVTDAASMPARLAELDADVTTAAVAGKAHAFMSGRDSLRQYSFFEPGAVTVGDVTVTADSPSQLMIHRGADTATLTAQFAAPTDGRKERITFRISEPLTPGTYAYTCGGLYPIEGETVTVAADGADSLITVELPDARDAARYRYQTDLYQAVPVTVEIPM